MESLSDRLKSLGFKPGSMVQPNKQAAKRTLEEVISAETITNSQGSFLARNKQYPYGYQQGKVTFSDSIFSDKINKASRLDKTGVSLSSMVFLDTETSGLSGGTGTFAFLVGIGIFTSDGFELRQFIIRDPAEESAMLLHLSNVIQPDSVFVTFNGKSFDIPLLSNRFVVNRIPQNLRGNPHVDVLHLSRRIWRKQLPSCALKDLERDILLMERSEEEVPGWMIPELYFDYLRTGDAEPLAGVVYHNAHDVVSLAALFLHISDMLEKNAELESYTVGDLIALGKIFLEMGSIDIAVKILQKCVETPLIPSEELIMANILLGKIHKGQQSPLNAVKYWVEAGNHGSYEACIELAIYYEHQAQELALALQWAEKANQLLRNSSLTGQESIILNLEKRINRLQTKASKSDF